MSSTSSSVHHETAVFKVTCITKELGNVALFCFPKGCPAGKHSIFFRIRGLFVVAPIMRYGCGYFMQRMRDIKRCGMQESPEKTLKLREPEIARQEWEAAVREAGRSWEEGCEKFG